MATTENQKTAGSTTTEVEPPPKYQQYQTPQDYYSPRVRDFQPPTPEIKARNADSDAESVLPSYAPSAAKKRFGNYRSEEAYLAALRAFVEEKDYVDGGCDSHGNPVGLVGFYGRKTGADYAAQPGPWDDRKKNRRKNSAVERGDAYASLEDLTADKKSKTKFWRRVRDGPV